MPKNIGGHEASPLKDNCISAAPKLEPHLAIPPISLPPPWPPSSTGAASAVSPQRTCRLKITLLDVFRPRLAPRRRSRTAGTQPPIGDKFTYFSDIVRRQGSIPRAKTRRPSPLSATLFRNGDAGGTFARGTFARGSFARDPVERRRALDRRRRRVGRGVGSGRLRERKGAGAVVRLPTMRYWSLPRRRSIMPTATTTKEATGY